MNCPRCGEISDGGCKCDSRSAACAVPPDAADAHNDPPGTDLRVQDSGTDDRAWRDELSDRLSRFRARRKIRPPRYPSLRLPFEAVTSSSDRNRYAEPPLPSLEPIAESSLALDPSHPIHGREEADGMHSGVRAPQPRAVETKGASAKIIEFPRFASAPPPPPPDQLAEPVIDRPRILEVPEVAPPLPALGGITIEAEELKEPEKRPGIDFPLQSASLARRVIAALIDGVIVTIAAALFGAVFWKIVSLRPPIMQLAVMAVAVPCLFWVVYQYLLTVYSGRTPGLAAAGLELERFDGAPTNRSIRRWRVLASYLSAASLGMGYAWVFLDEDALCWHDRITHTHLALRKKSARAEAGR